MEGVRFLLRSILSLPPIAYQRGDRMGKCIVCGKDTYRVLFSKAIVKIHICSEDCLKAYWKPVKGFKLGIQQKLIEGEGWLDQTSDGNYDDPSLISALL